MNNQKKEEEESTEPNTSASSESQGCCCGYYIPKRFVVFALMCLGMLVIHAMRVGIAITVVTILDIAPHTKVGTDHSRKNLPAVTWNSKMIGFLHSIFYVGFVLTQIPGGIYATSLSGHRIFGAAVVFSSTLNLMIPICIAYTGYASTCVLRFVQGLSEGAAIPALYRVLRDWSPGSSISRYGGWIFAGMYAGPIIGFPIDGALIHYVSWQFIFYFHGAVGILWFTFWFLLTYESPESHPNISKQELYLILEKRESRIKNLKVPWKEIFLSSPVWAVMICHFVKSWIFYLMLTNEPTYLNQFDFNLLENGLYSAMPHVLKVVVIVLAGYIADFLLAKPTLSRTCVRKTLTVVAFTAEGLCCLGLFFVSNGYLAVALLCVGLGLSGLAVSGWQINHMDLAPDYASVLAGISSAFGTIGGILSPILIGLLTHPQTLHNWQKSFAINAGVLFFGALVYLIFGSGEKQQWSELSETKALVPEKAAAESEGNERTD